MILEINEVTLMVVVGLFVVGQLVNTWLNNR